MFESCRAHGSTTPFAAHSPDFAARKRISVSASLGCMTKRRAIPDNYEDEIQLSVTARGNAYPVMA